MNKSVVHVAELWLPQGEVMAFGAGAYRGHHELMAASTPLRFHYGEGLPGAVWASGQALLWKELAGPFARAELAAAVGIDAAVGLPLFDGERLVAVLTLLLGNRLEAPSCIEVWDVSDELEVLKHARGYYVHCTELERFSPFIQFPRGTGLPGLTWLRGEVEVMEDLRKSSAFIRAGLAAKCGLKSGVGLPIYRNRRVQQVVTLFGAEQRSLVSSIELYHPQGSELGPALWFDFRGLGGAVGQSVADASGRPLAREVLRSRLPSVMQVEAPGGPEISLALPLHDKKGLKEIVVLRL